MNKNEGRNDISIFITNSRNVVIDNDILPDIFLKDFHDINPIIILFPMFKHLLKYYLAVLDAIKTVLQEGVLSKEAIAGDLYIRISLANDHDLLSLEKITESSPL